MDDIIEAESVFWTEKAIIAGYMAEHLSGCFSRKYTRISIQTLTLINLLLTGRIISYDEISLHCPNLGVKSKRPRKYAQTLISRVRDALAHLGCSVDTVYLAGYILPLTDLNYLREQICEYSEGKRPAVKSSSPTSVPMSPGLGEYDPEILIRNISDECGEHHLITLRHTKCLALLDALSRGFIVTHNDIWSWRGDAFRKRQYRDSDEARIYGSNLAVRTRKILKGMGISLNTIHGVGFVLSEEDARKLEYVLKTK